MAGYRLEFPDDIQCMIKGCTKIWHRINVKLNKKHQAKISCLCYEHYQESKKGD